MASLDLTDVLEDTSSRDDDDDADAPPPVISPAEKYYVDSSRTMLSLATMSIGAIDDDGQPLLDTDAAPN